MSTLPTIPEITRPARRPDRLSASFQEFVARHVSGGALLLLATVAALVWVNSPWADAYTRLWDTVATVSVGPFAHEHTLRAWVNDGLMAVFFFVVGLEIKRELLAGELRTPRRAAVPVVAALGGMAVPALIYTVVNIGGIGANGWGIPMATDIGFALAVVTALSRWVPLPARVFLVALAIVDDLGAVIVIAVFYTDDVRGVPIAIAGAVLAALLVANLLGFHQTIVYAVGGIVVWLAVFASGIHASIAGALVALTIPARSVVPIPALVAQGRHLLDGLEHAVRVRPAPAAPARVSPILGAVDQQHAIARLASDTQRALTPLQRMEHALAPWSVYVILPTFALANAGIVFEAGWSEDLRDPIALGVIAGLVIGKPIGIGLGTWLAVRLRLGNVPAGTGWRQIAGLGCLGGIGFTMSLFISNLAFDSVERVDAAKLGIFAASIVSAAAGVAILRSGPGTRSSGGAAGPDDGPDQPTERPAIMPGP